MTLAVFRQLPQADAHREDGTLAPMEFWGVVRYGIKDEGYLWAISASSGRLYRCLITQLNTDKLAHIRRYHADCVSRIDWWRKCKAALDNGENKNNLPIYKGDYWKHDNLQEMLQELQDVNCEIKFLENKEHAINALLALPQLFIAV